jgi:hypothetical protein
MYQANFVEDALYIDMSALQLASHARHVCAHVDDIFVNACSDRQDFYLGHASLLLRQLVQPLKRTLNTMYSKQLLDIFL